MCDLSLNESTPAYMRFLELWSQVTGAPVNYPLFDLSFLSMQNLLYFVHNMFHFL